VGADAQVYTTVGFCALDVGARHRGVAFDAINSDPAPPHPLGGYAGRAAAAEWINDNLASKPLHREEARRGTCRRPNLRVRHCRPGQCPPRPISSGWFALPRRWTLGQRPRHGDAITPISGRVACGTGALAAGSRGLPASMADKRQREAPLVRPNRRGQARRRGSVNTFQFSSISRNPRAATRTRRSRCSLAWHGSSLPIKAAFRAAWERGP